MHKLAAYAALVALALAGVAWIGPGALAATQPHVTVTVDRVALHSGENLKVSGTATITCSWLFEWNGIRRGQAGASFSTTYAAPTVTRTTKITLVARCFYPPSSTPVTTPPPGPTAQAGPTDVQTIRVVVPDSYVKNFPITVLPAGAVVTPPHHPGGNGVGGDGLPGTGGPPLWMLLAGALAVVLGAAAVNSSRRQPLKLPRSLR